NILGLLTETQVASELHVKIHTLRCWRSAGRGPAYAKLGRRIVYPQALLHQWVASQTITGDQNGKDERPTRTTAEQRQLALPNQVQKKRVDRRHRTGGYSTKRQRRLGQVGIG